MKTLVRSYISKFSPFTDEEMEGSNLSDSNIWSHVHLTTKPIFSTLNCLALWGDHTFWTLLKLRLKEVVWNIIWQYLKRFPCKTIQVFQVWACSNLRSNTQTIGFVLFLWNNTFSDPAKHKSSSNSFWLFIFKPGRFIHTLYEDGQVKPKWKWSWHTLVQSSQILSFE